MDNFGPIVIKCTTISGREFFWGGPEKWWTTLDNALRFADYNQAALEIHICRQVFRRSRELMKYYPKPEIVVVG